MLKLIGLVIRARVDSLLLGCRFCNDDVIRLDFGFGLLPSDKSIAVGRGSDVQSKVVLQGIGKTFQLVFVIAVYYVKTTSHVKMTARSQFGLFK